jgi:putative transposase
VWTWDITRLKGPKGQSAFHAYVILDIYSRMVVGWVVARREDADIAKALIERCLHAQGISKEQLIIHADRGAAMTSKSVAELLIDLGVGKSHSRPRTSNDNPFSEAQFKTVKYHHTYPNRFDDIIHARHWLAKFIRFYNTEHLHAGIGLMTPATIHHGQAESVIDSRQAVLDDAYQANPHRFRRPPKAPRHQPTVWINKPPQPQESTTN